MKSFTNVNGSFNEGERVSFRVENQTSGCWMWPTVGVLCHVAGEWVIETDKGRVTINKGYDAYSNSISKA